MLVLNEREKTRMPKSVFYNTYKEYVNTSGAHNAVTQGNSVIWKNVKNIFGEKNLEYDRKGGCAHVTFPPLCEMRKMFDL